MTSDLLEENQDLRKEITELRNNGFTVSAMTEQQLKVALEKGRQLEKENAELKKQVEQKQHLADVRLEQSLENYRLFSDERKARIDVDIALEDMTDNLTKAKEIIKKFSEFVNNEIEYDPEHPQEHTDLRIANEWHYVKDGDYPKEKGNYLVAWKRTHHVEEYGEWGFDVDLFNADEGYFEGVGDFVIAWKEIVLPKESE